MLCATCGDCYCMLSVLYRLYPKLCLASLLVERLLYLLRDFFLKDLICEL